MSLLSRSEGWNVDIDRWVNRIVPPSPLHKLPTPVTRFLGYRKEQKPDVGNVLGAFWSCLGAFCGLAVVAAVFNNMESIKQHHAPTLIASFGASAVLEYNAIRSPLGQPRNAFLGHTFSAIIGVAITKLFLYHSEFEKIRWIAGSLACGIASAVMLLTGCVHPPGGASALLAATSPEITAMGWYFVPIVMWGTSLMLIVGLVINNIQRQFPVYWWTPLDIRKKRKPDVEVGSDAPGNGGEDQKDHEGGEEKIRAISISSAGVSLPEDLALNHEEAELLESLRKRLRKSEPDARPDVESSGRSSAEVTMVPSRGAYSDSNASASAGFA